MKTLSFSLVIASAFAFAVGCSSSEDDHHGGGAAVGVDTKAACPTPQTATYQNFGQQFMEKYCLRCHSAKVQGAARQGAPGDHNFDTQDEVQGTRAHIDQKAGSGPASTNTDMPRNDPRPTLDERKKLAEWIACGAP